jgi:hypothetical protein
MRFTYEQKRSFLENGYVKIPGAVPKVMVDKALQAINHSVGEGMNVEDMPILRSRSYCPDINHTPVISDLLNKTPLWELAESLIGEGKIRPVNGGQIALRFPVMQDPAPKVRPHLDGMHSPTNGVEKGTIANFTAIIGVLLSDLPNPNSGNFTVWPGTHRIYEEYFKQHGPESLLKYTGEFKDRDMPPVDMSEPVQITGKPGDAVLVHYQVAHGITPNVSPNVRYACFFRLTHVDHEWRAPMTNIWMHWPGIREIIENPK